MNKKEIIDYLKSYTEPPKMMKVFPDCEIIKEAVSMLEQQEALSKPLAAAARRYAIPAYMKDVDENFLHEYPYNPVAEVAFIAGAKWQEEKDQETIKLAEDHAFLAGANWQKEQMMKGAVEGEICGRVYDHINVRFADGVCKYLEPKNISHIPADVSKYKPGDKVKIIIVKMEENNGKK